MDYFSAFSGIGGFEFGIDRATERAGCKPFRCVGFSEIDKYATSIYQYRYPKHKNYGDITAINVRELPDFNLFVGGFPCQAFSVAGKRLGFKDTRGTLFFDVARILKAKRPEWVLLENVKGLLNHDAGKTIATIYRVLTELGYSVSWEVVNSCKFGVPQNRERIFIVGHLASAGGRSGEILPVGETSKRASKGAGKTAIARTFTAGGHSGGMHSSMTLLQEKFMTNGNAYCLDRTYHKGVRTADKSKRTHIVTDKEGTPIIKSGTLRTHKDGEGFREVESGLAPTIPARARNDGSGQPVVRAVLTPDRMEKRQNGRRFKDNDEPGFTLTSQDKHGVQIGSYIRRLTPVECERLQAFPDEWTKFGLCDTWTSISGTFDQSEVIEISDTQRYKTLGNSVTTTTVEEFIYRIITQ